MSEPFKALPVRRVYIPKRGSSTKRRPLGIPVILDRCHQARVVNALEPEWEARFEPRSYGFRPGRGCHDAIDAIHRTSCGKSTKRRWVLDADLASAFDQIAHDHILTMLGTFPARGMVAQWLKAGVVEHGRLHRTEEGTPQGGVVSPVLLNIALHGMEKAAGVRYHTTGRAAGWAMAGSPVLIRYADDLRRPLPLPAGGARGQGQARQAGWRPGVFPSTRTRRASSPSKMGSISWGATSAATATSS